MSNIKKYFFKYFEQIVVLFILAAVVLLNYFIAEKLALLNLFYLPAIVAGIRTWEKKSPAYQYF